MTVAMSHDVQFDGRAWRKTPVPGRSVPDGLRRDHEMLAAAGVETHFEGETLVLPHRGEVVTSLTEEKVEEMIETLLGIGDDPTGDGLFSPFDYAGMLGGVHRRAAAQTDPADVEAVIRLAPGEAIDRPTTQRVAHCDAHLGNWLEGSEGLTLIDWEHASLGPAEIDLAWLYISILATERPDLAALVRAAAADDELLVWAARSWAAHMQIVYRRTDRERAEEAYRAWTLALL